MRRNPASDSGIPASSGQAAPPTVALHAAPKTGVTLPQRTEGEEKLLILTGPLKWTESLLDKERCAIGSDPGNDIRLLDETVSRRHCEILRAPEGYVLRDLGSTNGTWMSGFRVTEAILHPGVEFRVGNTVLAFGSPIARDSATGRQSGNSMAMHRVSRHGVGYSVAEWSDVRHVFAAAVPQRGTTLRQQADDALRIIATVNSVHGSQGAIVQQAVFVAHPSLIPECREIIRAFYGRDLPVTSYVPQAPCEGKLLAIEAIGLDTGKGEVGIDRISEELVVARHNGIAWIHAAPVAAGSGAVSAYDQGCEGFGKLKSLLAGVDVGMDRIVRTWLYQGSIVADEGASRRYKELNRARSDFYKDIRFLAGLLPQGHRGDVYPASTGIGTDGLGFELSAIAMVSDRPDITAVPLENPRQTAAYAYGAQYSPKSPKFSRAMAVSCGEYATIFISGTASITHSETQHIGDAAGQTRETLDNIEALISEENLARHGLPGLGTTLGGMGLARVYIKRKQDYGMVRAICERRLGEVPTVYAVADVCRPELLVEIEGIALSRKRPAPQ